MGERMRDEFEATQPRNLLDRSKDGYADPSTNREWVIWQRAWCAALNSKSPRVDGTPPSGTLTAEEAEFVKWLYKDSQA